MASGSTNLTPRTIGRYALYGEIAVGGMATVHFGRLLGEAGFARSVAIKRLHAHYARDPEFVAMFLDEARLAARIVHPNVVPTLDVVIVDEELFLVMEYVRGTSLARLLRASRANRELVPLGVVSSILAGALHGLHAAHDAKSEQGEPLDIVHRDVSPQNVMVGSDGVSRVLDFGVAKAVGRSQTTRDGQLKGKLAYMAPEQIRGLPVSRRTDVYAASVVLWEALTTERLYRAENEGNLISKVLEGRVSPPSMFVPGLPPALDSLVLRGLSLDPGKRFATAREMASELAACIPLAPAEEVGEWVERNAADELQERAARIADIERDSAVSQRALTPSLGATRVKPLEVPSGVSNISVAQPSGRPPPRRTKLTVIGVATAGLVLGVGLFALRVASRPTPRADDTPLPAQEPTLAASAPPQPSMVQDPSPLPSAPASVAAAPALPSSSAAVAKEPVSVAEPSARPASPRPPRAPTRNPQPRPDCTPPYTTDEHGHVHFKPECI
jgi:serine/threonine protein kinase